jgi:hypothetical protein
MSYKSLLAGVLLASASLNAPAALADTYNWSFTGSFGFSLSGTLTTGAADKGGFDITSFTGSGFDFVPVTIPAILAPGTFGGNDNLLFPNASPQLDSKGVAFTMNGSNEQISCTPSCSLNGPFNAGGGLTFTATLAVPGPIAGAGLPGLIFAGGGLLGWWRRRRKAA